MMFALFPSATQMQYLLPALCGRQIILLILLILSELPEFAFYLYSRGAKIYQ